MVVAYIIGFSSIAVMILDAEIEWNSFTCAPKHQCTQEQHCKNCSEIYV